MPTLAQSLLDQDLGHLKIVAELWGIELDAPNLKQARQQLVKKLFDKDLVGEVVESLPPEAKEALAELHHARLLWPAFSRRYGEIREIGPGKRDRTKPYLSPISTSEILWYRALIGRAFFESQEGPSEFVYLPEDLAALMPPLGTTETVPFSRPATPEERALLFPANDRILDLACTLLIALRQGFKQDQLKDISTGWVVPLEVVISLLHSSGLLGDAGQPLSAEVKNFLERPRGEALLQLTHSWLINTAFNDLRMMPQFAFEGEWYNDPLQTRNNVLQMLRSLQPGIWWSLPAFIATVKKTQPDFQRPAGDYDSWYIKDLSSDRFLRGFEYWDAVDGELLRYLICGPLHWLGVIDLGAPENQKAPSAFRFSKWADALLQGRVPAGLAEENEKLHIDTKLRLNIPPLVPRAVRYQAARFCQWLPPVKDQYRYRITPASLVSADGQGLKVEQLLAILRRHSDSELPPNLVKALKRWQQHGVQAQLQQMLVLKVGHPKILQNLRNSPAARFLGEPLGATSIVVKAGAWQQVIEALAEMGYFSEMNDSDVVGKEH